MNSKTKKLIALASATLLTGVGSSLSIVLCYEIITANPFTPSTIVPVAYATLLLGLVGSALTGWLAYACCLMYMTLSVVMTRRTQNRRRREYTTHRALAYDSDRIIESMMGKDERLFAAPNRNARPHTSH